MRSRKWNQIISLNLQPNPYPFFFEGQCLMYGAHPYRPNCSENAHKLYHGSLRCQRKKLKQSAAKSKGFSEQRRYAQEAQQSLWIPIKTEVIWIKNKLAQQNKTQIPNPQQASNNSEKVTPTNHLPLSCLRTIWVTNPDQGDARLRAMQKLYVSFFTFPKEKSQGIKPWAFLLP